MVPVVSTTGKPLMPCPPARARELVRKGKALRRFKAGIFYIQLTQREEGELQKLALGVDPGSKKEGFLCEIRKTHLFESSIVCGDVGQRESEKEKRTAERKTFPKNALSKKSSSSKREKMSSLNEIEVVSKVENYRYFEKIVSARNDCGRRH
jgi:hypothetical protein